ncbi:hypothetical protein [Actinoplanes awajinensis]|uniref:Uncharacterized protein n=1 Tax=Actinoplanes awajinensis subsp. mycoplanecinus TaxID=135947 RepID=A0A0X3V626_9ACTN|nr:hypothetical protein [Actinoplanes awajinensis]KUL39897.1 hypothetical protein ADL15_08730 [Actinoplanes awajinensis subsp. mycoplanecinus]
MTTVHQREAHDAPLSMPSYTSAGTRLSNTTRYLCTAAFLVPGFADTVVDTLIGDMRRSVPPSHGFDLDPIVRQCFRVRRRQAAQHAIGTVLLLVAAYLSIVTVLGVAALGALVAFARSTTLRELLERFRLPSLRWILAWALALFGGWVVYGLWQLIDEEVPSDYTDTAADAAGNHPWLALAVLLGIAGMLYAFRREDYRIVTAEFAPGAAPRRLRLRDTLIEDRLALIAAAQRGNVVVHHDNPFLGCGRVRQGWSLSLTLRPRTPDGNRPEEPVAIDAVALNQRIKKAIESMRADWLDEGQRVAGLSVRSYVVADGVRDEHDPVLDPVSGMPYTMADDATVDAIVANPQGGLRQYLRVVIPVRGKAIRDQHDDVILGAQALGISVSAFVHVAVEGGMLYAEFIGTVLPPLRPECLLADSLRPEKAASYALGSTLRTAIVDVVAGPLRLAQAADRAIRLRLAMSRSVAASTEFRTHDYGARVSVRDLASDRVPQSYLQKLDGVKYVKLVDRIVGEAIIDFLVEAGVDPLEFRQAVNQITMNNSSLVQVGTVLGGQNNFGGSGNVFTSSGGSAHA